MISFKLVWFAAFITAQGPQVATISESTTFKDQAMCEAFGQVMSDRLADYARGGARLDWDSRVTVSWKCEPDGRPA